MLIEVSVANYRSFRDRVTLSLEAEPRLSERDKSVDERNIAQTPEGGVLRVAGLYGANASGKSNLVRALGAFRALVLDSAREGQAGDLLPADPFLLDEGSAREPSEFEVVYVEDGLQVRYGAAFSRERFSREWLFARPTGAEAEERWFERLGDVYETGEAWRRDPGIEEKTRPEALHLSAAAAWRHPQAEKVLAWFKALTVVDGLRDTGLLSRTIALLEEGGRGEAIRTFVRRLDLGVDDLAVRRSEWEDAEPPRGGPVHARRVFGFGSGWFRQIKTVRRGVEFELANESAGTARAIALAGPIVEVLAGGGVMIVDEFDARLHTLLAKQIVELFQDPEVNRHDAQLIFASHDTNLLTRALLRRDQLWFVEKSHKTQSSDLYSLAELRFPDGKGVRNDARYEEDYLQGRYGAIPFFGDLGAILGEALEKQAK
ncbi:MAG: ATP-binding protein [Nannocystaceae bacterium]